MEKPAPIAKGTYRLVATRQVDGNPVYLWIEAVGGTLRVHATRRKDRTRPIQIAHIDNIQRHCGTQHRFEALMLLKRTALHYVRHGDIPELSFRLLLHAIGSVRELVAHYRCREPHREKLKQLVMAMVEAFDPKIPPEILQLHVNELVLLAELDEEIAQKVVEALRSTKAELDKSKPILKLGRARALARASAKFFSTNSLIGWAEASVDILEKLHPDDRSVSAESDKLPGVREELEAEIEWCVACLVKLADQGLGNLSATRRTKLRRWFIAFRKRIPRYCQEKTVPHGLKRIGQGQRQIADPEDLYYLQLFYKAELALQALAQIPSDRSGSAHAANRTWQGTRAVLSVGAAAGSIAAVVAASGEDGGILAARLSGGIVTAIKSAGEGCAAAFSREKGPQPWFPYVQRFAALQQEANESQANELQVLVLRQVNALVNELLMHQEVDGIPGVRRALFFLIPLLHDLKAALSEGQDQDNVQTLLDRCYEFGRHHSDPALRQLSRHPLPKRDHVGNVEQGSLLRKAVEACFPLEMEAVKRYEVACRDVSLLKYYVRHYTYRVYSSANNRAGIDRASLALLGGSIIGLVIGEHFNAPSLSVIGAATRAVAEILERGEPLETRVSPFLNSDAKILLIRGDSGAGKTCAALFLEHYLLYAIDSHIPHYIELDVQCDLHAYLERTCPDKTKPYVFICDCYDQAQYHENLYRTKKLNEWVSSKFIFLCRSQHLRRGYEVNFQVLNEVSRPIPGSGQELVLVPFDPARQDEYARKRCREPVQFMGRVRQSASLQALAVRPFALSLLAELWEHGKWGTSITEVFRELVEQRCQHEACRIGDGQLSETVYHLCSELAFQLVLDPDRPVRIVTTRARATEKEKLIYDLIHQDKNTRKASAGLLIRKRDDDTVEFLHSSLRDYFVAERLLQALEKRGAEFSKIPIGYEDQIKTFLAEMLQREWDRAKIKTVMLDYVKRSQSDPTGAANAISLLAQVGIAIENENLQGLNLPRANLSNLRVMGGDWSFANLKGAVLHNSQFHNVSFAGACLEGIDLNAVSVGPELADLPLNRASFLPGCTRFVFCASNGLQSCSSSTFSKNFTLTYPKVESIRVLAPIGGASIVLGSKDGNIVFVQRTPRWVLSTNWTIVDPVRNRPFYRLSSRHPSAVTALRYWERSNRLVSGSECGTVMIWDLDTDTLLRQLVRHKGAISSVMGLQSKNTIVSASRDGTIRIWPLRLAKKQRGRSKVIEYLLGGHGAPICLATNEGDERLLVGHEDGDVTIWDLQNHRRVHAFQHGNVSAVSAVAYGENGHCFSGGLDQTVREWTDRPLRIYRCGFSIVSLEPLKGGACLVGAASNGWIQTWTLVPREEPHADTAADIDLRTFVNCRIDKNTKIDSRFVFIGDAGPDIHPGFQRVSGRWTLNVSRYRAPPRRPALPPPPPNSLPPLALSDGEKAR